jgi:uncharacterized repeat protein (TIGR01451 family)
MSKDPMPRLAPVALLAGLMLAGCRTTDPLEEDRDYDPHPTQVTADAKEERVSAGQTRAARAVRAGTGSVTAAMAYPTGDRATSQILLTKTMPRAVVLNHPFEYRIEVLNLTNLRLDNVTVTDTLSPNFTVSGMQPKGQAKGNVVTWAFGYLAPKAAEVITVTGVAKTRDDVGGCASVSCNTELCAKAKVIEPAIAVKAHAPDEALLCDRIPVKFTVMNTGSGVAQDVVVKVALPEGLAAADGKNTATFNAGALDGGQSLDFTVECKASRPGKYASKGTANAAMGLTAESNVVTTMVYEPTMKVAVSVPAKRFGGERATFDIVVDAGGEVPCTDSIVEAVLPKGTTFVSATDGGQLAGNVVKWSLGTIKNGSQRKVSFVAMGKDLGRYATRVTARSRCAKDATATATVEYTGIPAILLEVVDEVDPVRVGEATAYHIDVTNQGSAADQDIKVVALVPDSMQVVSAGGATSGSVNGNTVTFAVLPVLNAKEKARWTLKVKAVKAADSRFKITLSTAHFKNAPVEETEATHVYE